MTFVGKLFVLVNLAFSAIMAVAAVGFYTTGMDYGPETKKDAQPKPPVRVTDLQKEIADVLATLPAVEGSWSASRTDLVREEEQRTKNRQAYDVELALLHSGPAMDKDQQVRAVKMTPEHLAELNPTTGLPVMEAAQDRAGQPLRPMTTYLLKVDLVRKENETVLADLNKKVKDDADLTIQLTGDPGTRGLRQKLVDERVKREGVIAEHNSVRPLFINVAVESQLSRKRLDALQEQIDQLKSYLRKMHKVDVAMDRR
jgi:hypothetical protein